MCRRRHTGRLKQVSRPRDTGRTCRSRHTGRPRHTSRPRDTGQVRISAEVLVATVAVTVVHQAFQQCRHRLVRGGGDLLRGVTRQLREETSGTDKSLENPESHSPPRLAPGRPGFMRPWPAYVIRAMQPVSCTVCNSLQGSEKLHITSYTYASPRNQQKTHIRQLVPPRSHSPGLARKSSPSTTLQSLTGDRDGELGHQLGARQLIEAHDPVVLGEPISGGFVEKPPAAMLQAPRAST